MTDPWSNAIDAGLSYLRTDGDAGDYRTSVEGVLRAALASMEADGLVVVPKEPTLDMLDDGNRAARATRVSGVSGMTIDAQINARCAREDAAYTAMIAARPPFPESK